MAKVIYRPDPEQGCPDATSQFGYDFVAGKPTEVDGGIALAKFAGHPFFSVEGDEKQSDPDELKAVHNGGGRYIITRGGDKSNPVKDGLDKADAAAFNALSDEDKAAYVAD